MRGFLTAALVVVAGLALAMPRTPLGPIVNARDGSVLLPVPAGPSIMGSDEDREDERPRRTVVVAAFYIGRTEITNTQFRAFVQATGYRATGYWGDWATPGRERHPVIAVSRSDARAYCRWAGVRLPTETEWEKAARGTDGRRWPWGDTWDRNRCCNALLEDPVLLGRRKRVVGPLGTLPVGSFPEWPSPSHAMDMAGNAWEWCENDYGPYPGNASLIVDPLRGACVARGGGWQHDGADCLRTSRRLQYVDEGTVQIGFRVCRDATP